MILAVMQPYLFPYIGYYQLAYHSDMFIFYDDVNYIKGGYINRNNILTKNGPQLFTLPVKKASSFKKINELFYQEDTRKILTSISQAYSKAPYFTSVFPIIEKVLTDNNRNVAHIASKSIIDIFEYLDINFNYVYSSLINYDNSKNAKEKLIEFCRIYNCNNYVNTIGGKKLYSKDEFSSHNIKLNFISSEKNYYNQYNSDYFEENLSIIDILMNISPKEVINILGNYHVE
ncbi:TPA: WbqC family protein [Proteus mirabilis]|uniref:WbqC family protein n=1 Tax=Proteus mirabilis TaxID=584 RepID=UPI001A214901|nr:WbqC family protein [Proteus mirabilis]MCT8228461.1 WbqC family protein [Proteus mirabilis]MDF7247337.1 WbqC family protein [Proteus mirabilis]MDF7406874.1 WbqC family protein [Proteus mirabilis]MDF7431549.1 WbqC family protein [Proteus mirabilis]HAT4484168.1 WbqC family protein [Proteus mirabilis]